jgi:hypothetical protein
MHNRTSFVILVLFFLFSCDSNNKNFKNFEIKRNEEVLTDLTALVYTSDGKYLAKASTGFSMDEAQDTVYFFDINMYQTNPDYQRKHLLSHNCDEDSMDICDDDEIKVDIEEFELLRKYKVYEELANYYVDFSYTSGLINGRMEWIESKDDTLLQINYLGTEMRLRVFNQKDFLLR